MSVKMQENPPKVQDMLKKFETNDIDNEKRVHNGVKRPQRLLGRAASPTINICTWSLRRRRDPHPAHGEGSTACSRTQVPCSAGPPSANGVQKAVATAATNAARDAPKTAVTSANLPTVGAETALATPAPLVASGPAVKQPLDPPALAPSGGGRLAARDFFETQNVKPVASGLGTEAAATPGLVNGECRRMPSEGRRQAGDATEAVRVSDIARLFQEKADGGAGTKIPRPVRAVEMEADLPTGPPPLKPARTFAHDIYCQNKPPPNEARRFQQLARTGSDQTVPAAYKPKPPPKPVRAQTVPAIRRGIHSKGFDGVKGNRPHTPPTKPPPAPSRQSFPAPYAAAMVANPIQELRTRHHNYGVLKRCFSEERVYDEPYAGRQRRVAPQARLDRRKSPSLALDKLLATDVVFIDNEVYHSRFPLAADDYRRPQFLHTRSLKSGKPPVELHYMSSPIIAMLDPTLPPTAPHNGHSKVEASHESTRALRNGSDDRVDARTAARRVNFRDSDVIDWSFYSIYATDQRNRRRPHSKDDDSGDSDNEISEKVIERRIAYIHRVSRGPSMRRDLMPVVPNYRRQFDAVLTVGLRYIDGTTLYEPYVKDVFPGPECLTADPEDVAHFCFPDAEAWRPTAQRETYTFVLTNEKGDRVFGYCRRVKPEGVQYNIPIVYCIISPILARAYYCQVLGEIERRHGLPEVKMRAFLQALRVRSVPQPGRTVTFKSSHFDGENPVVLSRSSDFLMDNADVSRLLIHLSVPVLLKVFASLLLERRVIFCASAPEALTECIHALLSLLYPFAWQHTLVPILPSRMLDVVASPTPYVVGILRSCQMRLDDLSLEEGVVVDLESSQLIREVGDERTVIPKEIQRALSTALKLIKSRSDATGSPPSALVSRAFLRMWLELVGHYPRHVSAFPDKQRIFHCESFCSAPPSNGIQMFLKWFTETPMFDRFIEDRTTTNTENDVFEQSIRERQADADPSRSRKYNVKEFSKKMRNFGEKLIGYKPLLKA